MSNTGAMPPGWYYAAGDPPGTQRYWDGAQWVGEPQPVAPAQPASSGYGAPGGAPPPYVAPSYGAPQPGFGGPAPAGYIPFSAASPYGVAAMEPAPIGNRIVAYIIDALPILVVLLLIVLSAIAFGDAVGPIAIIGGLALLPYMVWNYWWRRGRTGQSIGDAQQGIKTLKNETGEPVGFWLLFGRWFLIGLISNFTCGIVGLLDILWPLWDDRNQRLGDKMLSMTVVVA